MPAKWTTCGQCGYNHRSNALPPKCWCGTKLAINKWDAKTPLSKKLQQGQPAAASTETVAEVVTGPKDNYDSQRQVHSAEITRLEKIKDTLTEQDAALAAHLQHQITDHKKAIIAAKPLHAQIKSLEDMLERKAQKIKELNQSILEAYEAKKETETEVAAKQEELVDLKHKEAQETLQGNQVTAPSPDPALQMQLTTMQAAFTQMLAALAMVQGLPPEASTVVQQAQFAMASPSMGAATPQPAVRACPATPLGAGTTAGLPSSPVYPSPSTFGSPPHSGLVQSPVNLILQPSPTTFGPAQLPAPTSTDPRLAAAPYAQAQAEAAKAQAETFAMDAQDAALQDDLQQAAILAAVQSAQSAAEATATSPSFSSDGGIDLTGE